MSKLHRVKGTDGSLYGYRFECPGCEHPHVITTGWTFNGDLDRPTFSPSLLCRWNEGEARIERCCHSFIRDGRIEFLGDCTHALAGQTVEMTDVIATSLSSGVT